MKHLKSILFISIITLSISKYNAQVLADYNLLIVDGYGAIDAQTELMAMGHTVTIENAAVLISGYDYSPYNSILFMYDSPVPASMSEIITLNEACQLGIVAMRGGNIISTADLGASVFYSSTVFTIEINTHWITQPFPLGVLDLGFTYKSNVTSGLPGTTILGSVETGNGSLVIHNLYSRAVSPYYGHSDGMPWTADAQTLVDRIVCWASSSCLTTAINDNSAKNNNVSIFPNPTTGKLTIGSKGDLIMQNMLGEIISVQNLASEINEIDLAELPNGVYFIQIKTAEGLLTKKIVKQ